jgi:CRP-like cAMP-binding protein
MKFFKSIPFLARLPYSVLNKLNLSLEYVGCQRGQVVVEEGQPSTKLIIILDGEFLVRKTVEGQNNKRKRIVTRSDHVEILDALEQNLSPKDLRNY